MAKGASQPRLAEPGFAADDQIVMGADPIAGDQRLEHGPVKLARMLVVDILDHGLVPQIGGLQPRRQSFIAAIACLAAQKQPEPFGQAEACGVARGQKLAQGFGHAGKAQLLELGEGWMSEHKTSQL
jgi:hypothetical protein